MRRSVIRTVLTATFLLILTLAVGSAQPWDTTGKVPAGAMDLAKPIPVDTDFPTPPLCGSGRVYISTDAQGLPRYLETGTAAKPGDIVLLRATSGSSFKTPTYAPLARPFADKRAIQYGVKVYPYSTVAVPMDGKSRHQATFIPKSGAPVGLQFLNSDALVNGTERGFTWNYCHLVVPRHDDHEHKTWNGTFRGDGDGNQATLDPVRNAYLSASEGRTLHRSFYSYSTAYRDHEDWVDVATWGGGNLVIDLKALNGIWSSWSIEMRVYDLKGNLLASDSTKSGSTLRVSLPVKAPVLGKGQLDSGTGHYVQIYAAPKSKPTGSNVYYLPYDIKASFTP